MDVLLTADPANHAVNWWYAARDRASQSPEPIRRWLQSCDDSVIVDAGDIDEILSWCRSLPEWTGGPAHAPHPVVLSTVMGTRED